MSSWPQLAWRVSPEVWDRFVSFVESNHGEIERFVSCEVRRAVREYIECDRFAEIEEQVDRLVCAAGRTPADHTEKKSLSVNLDWDGRGRAVKTRVPPEDRDALESFAKQHDLGKGETLTRALHAYMNGGRAGRLADKLDRIEDDATALLEEVNDSGPGMSTKQRRTVAICRELTEQFTLDDLDAAIEEHAGGSEPTIRDYRERVIERKGVEPHPNNPELYLPSEQIAEITETSPDAPDHDRYGYDALDREGRIHAMRAALAERAVERNGGRLRMTAAELNNHAFDGVAPESTVRDMFDAAADADGFGTKRIRGQLRLSVDFDAVTDIDVIDAVGTEEPTETPTPASSTTATATATATDGGTDRESADAELDRIMSAQRAE